jgi:hypothetical protein
LAASPLEHGLRPRHREVAVPECQRARHTGFWTTVVMASHRTPPTSLGDINPSEKSGVPQFRLTGKFRGVVLAVAGRAGAPKAADEVSQARAKIK